MADKPSEMFMRILVCSSTYGGINCQCGKQYLCGNEDLNPYPDEIAEFEKLAEKEPENYIIWYDAIGMAEINGQTFVEGCACNGRLADYEKFIDSHEYIILEYYRQNQKNK